MGKVELIRIDFRMIHGQVMVKWLKKTGANTILCVNDAIAVDSFLGDIYRMAAPPDVKIDVRTRDDAINHLANAVSWDGKVLVLFKSVADAYYCYKKGFAMEELQIGGLGSAADRVNVYGPITLNKEDTSQLKEMNDAGVKVYFQQVPDDSSANFDKIFKKYNFGLI